LAPALKQLSPLPHLHAKEASVVNLHRSARSASVDDHRAPEVTRKRMYLETMERVLGGTDKIIIDSKKGQGVVPFLSLDQLHKRKEGGN
jgi:regulator of protease activity HflC (stomatin/prohibitin superfamily)